VAGFNTAIVRPFGWCLRGLRGCGRANESLAIGRECAPNIFPGITGPPRPSGPFPQSRAATIVLSLSCNLLLEGSGDGFHRTP
jgi:hypothetical protein